jgi:opacity protein-like surface antigen
MKKTSIALAFVAASVLAMTSAQASTLTDNTYGEVGYGTVTVTVQGDELVSTGVVRGIVGKQLTKNIAVEGHAATSVGSSLEAANGGIKLDSSFGAFVKASHDLTPTVTVFGRAGYVRNNVSALGMSDHQSGAAYGVGASYAVSKNGSITLDYTQLYNKDDVRANTVVAGYKFKF